MTTLKDYYKTGPKDMVDYLFRENTPELEKFYLDLGGTIELPQEDAIYPNIFKNLGRFDFNDIADAADHYEFEFDEFGQTQYGTLIEHVPTGYMFALIPDKASAVVFNFNTDNGWPTNIEIESNQEWIETDLDFSGTRVGGTTDFSPAAWPHFEDSPLLFAAQYLLPNGKRIHVFVDDEGDASWEIEGGANCAIVEGGPIPAWITLQPVEEAGLLLRNPHSAITPVRDADSKAPLAPSWIQGDETPNDVGYRFLMQFGDNSGGSGEDFSFGDSGDLYLFYKEETGEARALWQCC